MSLATPAARDTPYSTLGDIVFPYSSQSIIVVVIGRQMFRSIAFIVQERLCGNVLRTYGAYLYDRVVVRFGHVRSEGGQNAKADECSVAQVSSNSLKLDKLALVVDVCGSQHNDHLDLMMFHVMRLIVN